MISNNVLQLFAKIVQICHLSGAVPFSWDSKKRRLYITNKFDKLAKLWLCFQLEVGLQMFFSGFGIFVRITLVLHCNPFWNKTASCVLLPTCSNPSRHRDRGMRSSTFSYSQGIRSRYLSTISFYFFFPHVAPFPNELLPLTLQQSWIIYILIGLAYSLFIFMVWTTLLFGVAFILILIPSLYQISLDLRGDVPSEKQKCSEELRQPGNLTLFYRKVEIIHKLILENYGYFLIPMQTLMGQYGLVCTYSLILQWSEMDGVIKAFLLSQLVMIQGVWAVILGFGGWVYDVSTTIIKSWKYLKLGNKQEAKYMAKFRKSCKPMYLGYPGMFRIRNVTVLKHFQGLTRGTFRMLVTLRNMSER
ncbi:hypothetical protein Fcan01_00953 [Folsomia candida]|uniref:Uncharacterized protein n=1 Tax=Folsomia candida TaxID=158441 RepID=A0A226F150_FOLCA|nr:hypothetical protein Fcan01_00953 [Folsomia candida]